VKEEKGPHTLMLHSPKNVEAVQVAMQCSLGKSARKAACELEISHCVRFSAHNFWPLLFLAPLSRSSQFHFSPSLSPDLNHENSFYGVS
jgi:hypothetical protein